MKFVRFNHRVAVVAYSGEELNSEHADSELGDHVGLWFGEINDDGRPQVYTVPGEYVAEAELISPNFSQ